MSEKPKTYSTYKDLEVWQKGVDLAQQIYQLTVAFPEEEIYGLTGTLRHAALDVPTMIARGYALKFRHPQLFKQNLQFAVANVTKVETLIEIGRRLEYIQTEKTEIDELVTGLFRQLISLIKKVNVDRDPTQNGGQTEPANHDALVA